MLIKTYTLFNLLTTVVFAMQDPGISSGPLHKGSHNQIILSKRELRDFNKPMRLHAAEIFDQSSASPPSKEDEYGNIQANAVPDKFVKEVLNHVNCLNGKGYGVMLSFDPTTIFNKNIIPRLIQDGQMRERFGIRFKNISIRITDSQGTTFYTCTFDYRNYKLESEKASKIHYNGADDTDNQRGDIIFSNNYLLFNFENYINQGMHVLDIGTAKGNNALKALRKGAFITANDISQTALNSFVQLLNSKEASLLKLNSRPFPDYLEQPHDFYDTVLLSHVAHYLSGTQIRFGLKKIFSWLKPQGRFFFQALTPYSGPYYYRASEIETLEQLGTTEWPGWRRSGYSNKNMPNFGHPLPIRIIERELIKAGFKIVYLNYGSIDEAPQPSSITYEEHEFYIKRPSKLDTKQAENLRIIQEKLKQNPDLRKRLDKDHETYQKGVSENNMIKALGLPSMQIIEAIAERPHD